MAWDPGFETAFHPRAVAFVGVRREGNPSGPRMPGAGSFMLAYRGLGFEGRIYPINPYAAEVHGYKAYPSLRAVPEPLDFVIVSVPAGSVPEVLEDCIAVGARNVHIFTAGFRETGDPQRVVLEEEVKSIARRGGLRVVGPNGMGLYVPKAGISPFEGLSPVSGPVAFLSQSGGHANDLCHKGKEYGVYFSKVVSFGNAMLMDSTDFLEYLATDPETRVIAMYLEGVRDGPRLFQLVRELNPTKPVVIWKGGLTTWGARATASHTGSLAGHEATWDAFFRQTGAVRAYSTEEMLQVLSALMYLPPTAGRRVAVIGIGGGNAVAAADACAREGLQVPPLSPETVRKIAEYIPPAGNIIGNPLDVAPALRNVSLFSQTLETVCADPAFDMVIVVQSVDLMPGQSSAETDKTIEQIVAYTQGKGQRKPLVVATHSFRASPETAGERARLVQSIMNAGVPVYPSLATAARALARFAQYQQFRAEGA